ncbi:MAG: TIGR04283 family arsenosugar biosynthesis glycosyltransferase [Rhodothermales bacterium]|nr:TIGR04283 family arsenosugar biosynthesis glycosyltransferase [Rhodothermales bacterium]
MPLAVKISVVIPALNEARRIEATLASVRAQAGPSEVVVVDGGSTDGTPERAAAGGARVLSAAPGRARQMNAGAEATDGAVLLFLHADTLLPPDAFEAIRRTLTDPRAEAGAFRLAFDRWTPLLRFYSFCTRFALPRICFGDRGLFVRRAAFEAVGGFPPMPMFEDLELVQRLHRRGGFRFLPQHVTTAARRFHRYGPLRQQLLNTALWLRYVSGADLGPLRARYRYDAETD